MSDFERRPGPRPPQSRRPRPPSIGPEDDQHDQQPGGGDVDEIAGDAWEWAPEPAEPVEHPGPWFQRPATPDVAPPWPERTAPGLHREPTGEVAPIARTQRTRPHPAVLVALAVLAAGVPIGAVALLAGSRLGSDTPGSTGTPDPAAGSSVSLSPDDAAGPGLGDSATSQPAAGEIVGEATTSTAVAAAPGQGVLLGTLELDRIALLGTLPSPEISSGLVSRLEEAVGPGNVDTAGVIIEPSAAWSGQLSLRVSDDIGFAPGSDTIEPTFFPVLDQIVTLMQSDPNLSVLVKGHTDAAGDSFDNLALSQRRAEAVVDYVSDGGINSFRLEPQGVGSTEPIADNDTPEGRSQNRRIEFTLFGFQVGG